jgi:Protein of unknown function (DUF4232)
MNDDRSKLEQLMRDRAAEVPHRQDAPPRMLGRARRRVVRNVLASVVAVGLIVAGASAGLANLGALRGPHHSLAGPPSTTAPATLACTAGDLRATASLQGAMGSVLGPIDVTNFSSKTCTLQGRPVVGLSSSTGHRLSPHVQATPPQWQVDGKAAPHGWPVVTLRPGAVAAIRIGWSNECPQLSGPARWTVGLGGGRGTLDVFGTDTGSPPPCNGATQPSILEVGPFEPGTE